MRWGIPHILIATLLLLGTGMCGCRGPAPAMHAETALPATVGKGKTMPGTTHTTEEYWGRTLSITTKPQPDGRWGAIAAISGGGKEIGPLQVRDEPSAEAAVAAVRALAAGAIDAQRVGQGKP